MGSGSKLVRLAVAGVSLAALALMPSGCVYIPTPNGEAVEGREVRDEDLAFMTPGTTTKDEVIAHFGNPTMFWRDENILIYRWVKRKGVVLWAVAAGYSASFGAADVPQELAFLLKFDGDDRFVNSEIVEKPISESYGDFLREWRDTQRAHDWKPKGAVP